MPSKVLDYIHHAKIILDNYENQYKHIDKITNLVQENQEYFDNPVAGKYTLEIAADKLERLIEEYNNA